MESLIGVLSWITIVLPSSELVYLMKQTVKLLRLFINVSTHRKTRQPLQVPKIVILRFSAAVLFIPALLRGSFGQVAPWCLSEVWGWPWSKMRPVWHAALEGRGGFGVGVGTAVWLRAPSLLKLQHATCASFVKFGKSCHFVTGARPRGVWRIRMHQWAEVLIRSGRTKGEGQWSNNSCCWAAARDRDTFPGWFTVAGSR